MQCSSLGNVEERDPESAANTVLQVFKDKSSVDLTPAGADPEGGGMGGSCPAPPSSGVYDVILPWPRPRPSYYNARTRALALERSRSLVLPRQLQRSSWVLGYMTALT